MRRKPTHEIPLTTNGLVFTQERSKFINSSQVQQWNVVSGSFIIHFTVAVFINFRTDKQECTICM